MHGYMRFRWEDSPGKSFFEELPDNLKAPLMAGFEIFFSRWEWED